MDQIVNFIVEIEILKCTIKFLNDEVNKLKERVAALETPFRVGK